MQGLVTVVLVIVRLSVCLPVCSYLTVSERREIESQNLHRQITRELEI